MNFLTKDGLLKLWTIIKDYVANAIVNKVDKEDGKGLSTNDYTNAEKEKLAGVEAGANKTVVYDGLDSESATDALSANQGKILDAKIDALEESIGEAGYGDMMKATYDTNGNGQVDKADDADKLGGVVASDYALKTDLPTDFYGKEVVDAKLKTVQDVADANAEAISGLEEKAHEHANKAVLDGISAEKVSAWDSAEQNANNYADGLNEAMDGRVETLENAGYQNASQVQTAINEAVGEITSFEYQVVDALPDAGEKGVVYLVPNGGSGNNVKDEYIWIDATSVFEKIGTTEIDLEPYVLEEDLVAITDAEIEAICV